LVNINNLNYLNYKKKVKNWGQPLNGDKIVLIQGLTPHLHTRQLSLALGANGEIIKHKCALNEVKYGAVGLG